MQFSKSKTIASAITLFLMLTIAITLVAVPLANAHDPPRNIPTFAYINVAPNPIGVGQQASVVFWLDNVYDEAAIANDYRFYNYKLTITAPDGDTETQTFEYVADSTSSQHTLYTPTQAGTYTFDFTFPGQDITAGKAGGDGLPVGGTGKWLSF